MPLRRKKFILALQPYEAVPNPYTAWSPARKHTLAFGMALILLMGLAFSMTTPEAHLAAVKKGLTKIALGTQICPYMPQNDARMLLNSWYGITISCTEPTEKMWLSYCQNMYVGNTALDCDYISKYNPTEKANIMKNMRICKAIGG
jgi:hypothetical protein